jgi:hypothetical protein
MTSWTEARVVDEVPSGYIDLTENGFGAMVGWFAGSENVVRMHDSPGLHTVQITTVSDGTSTGHGRERSQEEQDIIDDEIDSYLSDCRIPPGRPRGFRWFVRLPHGVRSQEFWPMINAHLLNVGPHPAETAQAVRELLATKY